MPRRNYLNSRSLFVRTHIEPPGNRRLDEESFEALRENRQRIYAIDFSSHAPAHDSRTA